MSSLITRSWPNAVIYDLTHPSHTKITLPRGSTWSSGLHWHETHIEYLRVLKGSVRVRLGDTFSIISVSKAGDNKPVDVKVDQYQMHEWSRADLDGEEVVVVERTDPVDGE
ncbi:hypothetical protein MMC14_001885 [Varicellaria rhodocarpa]|nr:hypothetical protein [Varicellaria rhodocarpa]